MKIYEQYKESHQMKHQHLRFFSVGYIEEPIIFASSKEKKSINSK